MHEMTIDLYPNRLVKQVISLYQISARYFNYRYDKNICDSRRVWQPRKLILLPLTSFEFDHGIYTFQTQFL